MSNPNEYRIDGRLFIKEIKSCVVEGMSAGEYQLICKIHQRGEKYYRYRRGDEYMPKPLGEKGLYLSEHAITQLGLVIDAFEDTLKQYKAQAGHFRIDAMKTDVWLVTDSDDSYSYLFEYSNDEGEKACRLFKNRDIHDMMYDLHQFMSSMNGDTEKDRYAEQAVIRARSLSELQYNPFYKYALDTGDEKLLLQIKLYFGLETNDECERYSELIGKRILPRLPIENDKEYAVFTGSIDFDLLIRSGYSVLHVPYFSMRGRTHDMFEINPHKKVCKDAAHIGMEGIRFDEYLDMFDRNE